MLYSELAKTYRKLFKKYPNISSLQDFGGKILEEKTTYAKRGTRWVEVKKEEKEVSATYVFNVFDAVQFFKDLGGYEKVSCGYTKAGYLPDELLSISPNRMEKTVRKYYFIKKNKVGENAHLFICFVPDQVAAASAPGRIYP